MAVLERQPKQLIQTLFMSQCIAAIILAVHLLMTASKLSATTGTEIGKIAVFELYELSRQALAGGGYSGSIRFLPTGLLLYFGIALFISLVFHVVRSNK